MQEPHSVCDPQIVAMQNFLSQTNFISLFLIGDNIIYNLMYEHGTTVNFVHYSALCVRSLPVSSVVRARPEDLVVFITVRIVWL